MASSLLGALWKVVTLVPLNAPEVERVCGVKLETLDVPELGKIGVAEALEVAMTGLLGGELWPL